MPESNPDPATADGEPGPASTSSGSRPRWLLVVRGVVFVLTVAYLWSGLVGRQLLESKPEYLPDAKYLPAWVMFGGAGVKRSQVEYWILTEDGQREVVDPYEILGLERSKKSPQVFRISGRVQAHRLGQRLCRELGKGTDLRMKVRTARRTKWKIESRGKQNVCTTSPHKKKKKKKKKKKTKKNTEKTNEQKAKTTK